MTARRVRIFFLRFFAAAAFEIFISIFQRRFAFIQFFPQISSRRWNVYYVRMSHKINVIAHEKTDFCSVLFAFIFLLSFFFFLREEKSQIFTRNLFSFFLSTDSNYALCFMWRVEIVGKTFHSSLRQSKHCAHHISSLVCYEQTLMEDGFLCTVYRAYKHS